MKYLGLDVHRSSVVACLADEDGTVIGRRSIPADRLEEIISMVNDVSKCCAMMESGTYSYKVLRFLIGNGMEAHVVHAGCLKVIAKSSRKTDANDADNIARYLRLWKHGEVELSISYIPNADESGLCELCRLREAISKDCSDRARRIRSHMSRNIQEIPCRKNLASKRTRDSILAKYPEDPVLRELVDMYSDSLTRNARISE